MTKIALVFAAIVLFIILNLVIYLLVLCIPAYFIYTRTLKRRSKDQWCDFEEDEPGTKQGMMHKIGREWQKDYDDIKKEVHIVRDGANLYGEYYDFGYDKTVMILSGRTENRKYGYYFAAPYHKSGFNVFVFDPRAHGKSDGVYNTVGFEESKDARAWSEFLHQNFGVDFIVYHGICIGAATGMYVIASDDCPDYVKGIVTEGMFKSFSESMKNHLIERKKNYFPVLHIIDMWMRIFTGHSYFKGPVNVIGNLKKPILMLQSKKDRYSTPENAQNLFDVCQSDNKKIVYFDEGEHSMLRITDTEKYDSAIKEFIETLTPQCVK